MLDSFHCIAVITDHHDFHAFALQFIKLYVGYLFPKVAMAAIWVLSYSSSLRVRAMTSKSLGKNDRVSLIRTDGVVVVEQFREIVVRGVAVTQYFILPVIFRLPVVGVDFCF